MGWLRAHRRNGVAVALLAMVLQICCLFGHVHLRDVGVAFALKSQMATTAGGSQNALADHGTLPPDGDTLCATCLVGHLASSAIAASAPILGSPVVHVRRDPFSLAQSADFGFGLALRSRGPPAV